MYVQLTGAGEALHHDLTIGECTVRVRVWYGMGLPKISHKRKEGFFPLQLFASPRLERLTGTNWEVQKKPIRQRSY